MPSNTCYKAIIKGGNTQFIILLLLVEIVSASEEIPVGIQSIADTILKDPTVSACFNSGQSSLGLSKKTKLKNIKVGTPFQRHSLNIDLIKKDSLSKTVTDKLEPKEVWRIPLNENGMAILLVEIVKDSTGKWIIGSVGGHGFALSWGIINKIWAGNKIIFCDAPFWGLFFIPNKGDSNLTTIIPIDEKSENALKYKDAKSYYSKLTSSSEVFDKIRKRK